MTPNRTFALPAHCMRAMGGEPLTRPARPQLSLHVGVLVPVQGLTSARVQDLQGCSTLAQLCDSFAISLPSARSEFKRVQHALIRAPASRQTDFCDHASALHVCARMAVQQRDWHRL